MSVSCTCRDFCQHHGRTYVARDSQGEFCSECSRDGWVAELCTPSAFSCLSGRQPGVIEANRWERQFMCAYHALLHRLFCWSALTED